MFFRSPFWFDPLHMRLQSFKRQQFPLHYHLRRKDYIAFRKELLGGSTDIFRVDECGRTALDLAMFYFEDLLISSFSSSFPIDFFRKSLDREITKSRLPLEIKETDNEEQLQRVRNYSTALRLAFLQLEQKRSRIEHAKNAFNLEGSCQVKKHHQQQLGKGCVPPEPFAVDIVNLSNLVSYPEHAMYYSQKYSQGKKESDVHESIPGEMYHRLFTYEIAGTNCLQRLYQDNLTLVVEDSLKKPTSKAVKQRLKEILRDLSNLMKVIKMLVRNEQLKSAALANKMKSSSTTQNEPLLLENLHFPYLYLSTLEILFEMYPFKPSQELLKSIDVGDARRLVNLVVEQRLKGHEIIVFLSGVLTAMHDYICTLGPEFFKPKSCLGQYLLHCAFCLHHPQLFALVCKNGNAFSVKDIYDWNKLIKDTEKFSKKLSPFVEPLLASRLKTV